MEYVNPISPPDRRFIQSHDSRRHGGGGYGGRSDSSEDSPEEDTPSFEDSVELSGDWDEEQLSDFSSCLLSLNTLHRSMVSLANHWLGIILPEDL